MTVISSAPSAAGSSLAGTALLTRQPDIQVAEVMNTDAVWVKPDFPQKELAMLFRDHNLVSVAVADEDGKLIGLISIGDVVKATIAQKEFIIEQLEQYVKGTPYVPPESTNAKR